MHLPQLSYFCRFGITSSVILTGFIFSSKTSVFAQLIPDNTLGSENSVVTPNVDVQGDLADLIEGGAIRNVHLFHSFSEFNVGELQRVYFANPTGIENIFSRVTGGNISNILGTLGVDGSANLFLLNPNGIFFGENAFLDVSGSFFATTADSFVFGDQGEFSATNPDEPPLLTLNLTPGIQWGETQPAGIANAGNLRVRENLTLASGALVNTGELSGREGTVTLDIAVLEGSSPFEFINTTPLADTEATPIYAAQIQTNANGNMRLVGTEGYGLNEGNIVGNAVHLEARTLMNRGTITGGQIQGDFDYFINSGDVLANVGGIITLQGTERFLQTDGGIISTTGGIISLDAPNYILSGTLDVSNPEGVGGKVEILGDYPTLLGTTVEASGLLGGGEVLIGGDYQGQGGIPTAENTFVNAYTTIHADALENGDGGKVILWSENTTNFSGTITARGGTVAGDGGFVEVSGKQGGTFAGLVDAGATVGQPGVLLLDPKNITITNTEPTSFQLVQTFLNPTPESGDEFGISVAIDGNNVVIGASGDDTGAEDAGAVYLFDLNGTLLQTFLNPEAEPQDRFGVDVDIDEDIVVVSARDDNFGAEDAGSVYLFSTDDSSPLQTIRNPTPDQGDQFGWQVAIDEGNVVIGSPREFTGTQNTGVAFLFDTDGNLRQTLVPEENLGNQIFFGDHVAIDGNHIVVGAPFDNIEVEDAGSAYLFDLDGNRLQIYSNPTPDNGDRFGTSVAIDGEHVVVGAWLDDFGTENAGTAYLFDLDGNLLHTLNNPTPESGDRFGDVVQIDGNRIVVEAAFDNTGADDAGSVYIFNTEGELLDTIHNPYPNEDDRFGLSVAIDGDNLIVGAVEGDTGAEDAGAAYLFSLEAAKFSLVQTFLNPFPDAGDEFGGPDELAINEGRVLIGSVRDSTVGDDAGSAYLFSLDGSLLQVFNNPTPEPTDSFGISGDINGDLIAISADANSLEGVNQAGSVYLFNTDGLLVRRIDSPVPGEKDAFGRSVSMDENYIVIGAFRDDTVANNSGSAYLFDINGNLLETLDNPNPAQDDNFGFSVSIENEVIVVGARGDSVVVEDDGAAYLFDINGNLLNTLSNPNPSTPGEFGFSVAIESDNVIVGAPRNGNGIAEFGVTYLFDINGEVIHTLNNPTLEVESRFGDAVAIEGNYILVGADNGLGTAYLFDTDGNFLQTFNNPTPEGNDRFGSSVAIDNTNILIGAYRDNTGANDAGAAYLFAPPPTLFNQEPGGSFIFDADFITQTTNTGTDIILQANTDITVDEPILTNNINGIGGDIIFQAGRSILVNADITTDNGNLFLTANEILANGVIDGERDPGAAVITLSPGTTINAGTGDVTLTLNTGEGLTNNQSGDITLNNIQAENLIVTSNGSILGEGTLTINGDARFITLNNGNITLDANAHQFSNLSFTGNEVSIAESNDTNFFSSTATGNLTVTSVGNITQTETLLIGGDANFDADNNNIFLTDINNQFGSIGLTGNDVSVIENDNTNFLTSTITGDLTFNSGGQITQTGILSITGDVNLSTTLPNGGNVLVTNDSETTIGNSLIGGNFTLTSGNPITQTPGESLQVAGNISVNGGGSDPLENQLGIPQSPIVDSNGNVFITEVGTITLDENTVTGNLTVTSLPQAILEFNEVLDNPAITLDLNNNFGGTLRLNTRIGDDVIAVTGTPGITQVGTQIVNGNATFNAGEGNISLNDPGNQFGNLTFNGNEVSITEANQTNLLTSTVTGNLTLTSGGAIIQQPETFLNIAGDLTLATTLANAGNVFLTNTGTTVLGRSLIGGNLTIDSGELISILSSEFVQVAGTTTILNPGDNPPLDAINNIVPIQEFSNGDVIITKVGTIDVWGELDQLDNPIVTGNLTVTSLEDALNFNNNDSFNQVTAISLDQSNRFGGTLRILTEAPSSRLNQGIPNIIQSNAIEIVGDATLTAIGGNITLDNQENQLGNLAFVGRDISIHNQNSIHLLDSTVTGDLNLIANGGITQQGSLIVTGTSTFTSELNNASIILDNLDNQFSGAVGFVTTGNGGVNLFNSLVPTQLNASSIPGNFTVTSGGDITQIGNLTVTGLTTLNAGNSNVTLDLENDFSTVTVNAGREVSLNDINDINMFPSGVFSSLTVNAMGDITTQSIFSPSGPIFLTSTTGNIDTTEGTLSTSSLGEGGNITLLAEGDIQLGNLDSRGGDIAGGDISITSLNGGVFADNRRITSETDSSARAGNITISGNFISLTNGNQISTKTLGTGVGGFVTILSDGVVEFRNNSDLFTQSQGRGRGGNIQIEAQTLTLLDGSLVTSDTDSMGDAGDIVIETQQLLIQNSEPGSTEQTGLSTSTLEGSQGQGGNLTINATEFVRLIGNQPGAFAVDPLNPGQVFEAASTKTGIAVVTFGSGNAGMFEVNTNSLIIQDGAGITTSIIGSTGNGGELRINADFLDFQGKAGLIAATAGEGNAGNIIIENAEQIILNDGAVISVDTVVTASGDANNLDIQTDQLSILNGSRVSASTANSGDGGTITVTASEFVEVIGISEDETVASGLFTTALSDSTGVAGSLLINTPSLILQEGGEIAASSISSPGGNIQLSGLTHLDVSNGSISASTVDGIAGSIDINVSESVQVSNQGEIVVEATGNGQAGSITLTTSELTLTEGAIISASNIDGEGGSIEVTANRLTATTGGNFQTKTSGSAQAGNIILQVVDNITLTGQGTGIFATTDEGSTGNGGNIDIDPSLGAHSLASHADAGAHRETVNIEAGAAIATNSLGSGTGGNIDLTSGFLFLDNGSITAETTQNQGGNVTLSILDRLELRNESLITATAGTAQAGGDGGNINIRTDYIIAFPSNGFNGNDIIANAFEGNGGRIDITATRLFNIAEGRAIDGNQTNDIDASSEFGDAGIININTPNLDPAAGLINLPVDPGTSQPLEGCRARSGNDISSFINSGRGGMPPTPYESLSNSDIWEDLAHPTELVTSPEEKSQPSEQLVEAQGWIINEKGVVELVANPEAALARLDCTLR